MTSPSDDGFHRLRQTKRYARARQIVVPEGEDTGEVLALSSGWALSYRMTSDGRRQILWILLPGETIGLRQLFFEDPEPAVKTITDAEFCVFDRTDLLALTNRAPTAKRRAHRVMGLALGRLERNLITLGKYSAIERIARFILDLHLRLDSRGLTRSDSMPYPLSHDHLADALGLTPLHVQRVLKILKSDGLIAVEEKGLEIKDRRRLMHLAGYGEADFVELRRVQERLRVGMVN